MGFKESINGFFNLYGVGKSSYRVTAIGNLAVHVEGVKKICDLSSDKIALLVKGGTVVLYGENLSVGSFVDKDVTVVGNFIKMEWQA